MTRYVISFEGGWMAFLEEDVPAVTEVAHEGGPEAQGAVWIFGGGLEGRWAGVVATGGAVTAGPHRRLAGRDSAGGRRAP